MAYDRTQSRIRWTPDECAAVAQHTYKYMLLGEMMKDAVRKGQVDALKLERRRTGVTSAPILKTLKPFIDKERKAARAGKGPNLAGVNDPEHSAPELPAPFDFAAWLVAGVSSLNVKGMLADALTSGIKGALSDPKTRAGLVDVAASAWAKVSESQLPAVRVEPAVPGQKRVVIVGLLNGQQQMIEKEFGGMGDLRFVPNDCSLPYLRGVARDVDSVLLMTKFTDHARQDVLKKINAPLSFVSGGMSQLREALVAKLVHGEKNGQAHQYRQ